MLSGVCLFVCSIFFLFFAIKVKCNRGDYFDMIQMIQRMVAFVLSVFIWGIFRIHIGLVLWLLLFFILRCRIFRTNAKRLQELYEKFHDQEDGYPQIQNVRQWKQMFFSPKNVTKTDNQFKYHFLDFVDSSAPLLVFSILDIVFLSNNPAVYNAEFLIVATSGYVFLGKIVYHLSLHAPSSVFYLSPGLAYIPTMFVGIVYYTIVIIMLLTMR
jgi:hypothetical protein